MQEAYQYLIDEIIEGRIQNSKDLEKAKHRACREFKLLQFISNADILKNATPEERVKIAPIIKKKPTRTASGVAVVAVMCKPHQCPHGRCLYCPESSKAPPSYTGEEPAALRARRYHFHPYLQVYNRLLQLESIGHPLDKVELIIMGGTFSSSDLCYQEWFVTKCLEALNDFGLKRDFKDKQGLNKYEGYSEVPEGFSYLDDVQIYNEKSKVRCVGMTFETRPDYCKAQDIDRMLNMGVTRVELGVQTIYNFIYSRIGRGHRVEDVVESARLLRDSGIKVAMHMMPGLFADQKRDLRIFKRLFNDERFKPDMLKIYPCLVTEGSGLHELWEQGEYQPYSTQEAVDLIVQIKKLLPKWVRTMRIQRDIPSPLIEAGVKKSNLGELVYKKLDQADISCHCIRCREVGHQVLSNNKKPELEYIKLQKEVYKAGRGEEIFISYEDIKNDILIGFLRLRIPSPNPHRPEVDDKTALIRELHVYGSMVPLGDRKEDLWQHQGYGVGLLDEAENTAAELYDRKKILINSGIGVRNYYKKIGYGKEGPYMAKYVR
ncbi:MAG: tRNA uridine(34) 5-carboxymethylaminomethyl modification radical SAM/GNAT enzyme Elp3 [Methanobacterium sp.]|nr:tRNA uridine(34) 5-carboxymethylaminomethyl modification radical SAM/GNAT enzyme Elp3 [Methanobacterium sp.]